MLKAVELLVGGATSPPTFGAAAELLRVPAVDVVTLTGEFAERRCLAAADKHDRRSDAARADAEKLLPTFVGQLQLLVDSIERLLIAGRPLADAADKLRRPLPQ